MPLDPLSHLLGFLPPSSVTLEGEGVREGVTVCDSTLWTAPILHLQKFHHNKYQLRPYADRHNYGLLYSYTNIILIYIRMELHANKYCLSKHIIPSTPVWVFVCVGLVLRYSYLESEYCVRTGGLASRVCFSRHNIQI